MSIELQCQGRSVKAQRITIRPYDDPKKARYLKFADKSYEFVLSDVIPGVLYSIRSVTLDPRHRRKSGGRKAAVQRPAGQQGESS